MSNILKNLSICIITYKANSLIFSCLKNISQIKNIFILDNSNDVNLKNKINREYKNVKFYLSKNNLGFSCGHNFLLKKIKTKYVMLLNPDVEIKMDALKKLYQKAESLDKNFAIISPDYENKINYNQNKLIEKREIYFGCPLFNYKIFKKIGFFDSNFFLYFEDNDVCKRFLKNNNKIYIYTEAKVSHIGGKSSNDKNYDKLRSFHYGWSKIYYYRKHYSFFYFIIIVIFTILKSLIALLLFSLLKKSYFLKYKMIIYGVLFSLIEHKDFHRKIYAA